MRLLKDITLGQFFPGESVVHQLDPRTKLILSLIVMSSLFSSTAWLVFGVWTAVFLIALKASSLQVSLVLKNLRPFRWLFAITILLNLFYGSAEGKLLFRHGQIAVFDSQVSFAFLHSYRLILFILFSSILTLTTSPLEITDALEKMLKPLKRVRFPVHEFTMMVSIAMRFIPTVLHEADRIRKAQLSRGADFSGSLIRRIQALIPLTLPLFLSTFQRAEELATAMEARCYDANASRSQFNQLVFAQKDVVLLLAGATLAMSLLIL